MTQPRIRAVIEITAGPSGELPADLLIAAYRASQWDRIALVLNGVLPEDVDCILDPIVRTLPLDIPGLTYIDVAQGPQVRDALLEASAEGLRPPWPGIAVFPVPSRSSSSG